ncbi:hypothetical protein GWI33_012757 [Rhynchophorus ferrugineus]|uniref:Uncharacterized protein n=1 Tax=Rhynchophorus ferrugineus TaxID=354439 RepID=A0A834IS12_RHYFE|nr:hypothetical protein GWI33_012757 [Rhynchophorus ferrugineus]
MQAQVPAEEAHAQARLRINEEQSGFESRERRISEKMKGDLRDDVFDFNFSFRKSLSYLQETIQELQHHEVPLFPELWQKNFSTMSSLRILLQKTISAQKTHDTP